MIPVIIQYREPVTFRLWKRSFITSIPSNWFEASELFCRAFAEWLLDGPKNGYYAFIAGMLPFPGRVIKSLNKAVANDFLPYLEHTIKRPVSPFTMMPSIKVKGAKDWLGPQEQFAQMTVAEFILAERMVNSYAVNKDEKYLNELVAILYRPAQENGLRNVFNPEEVMLRVPVVKSKIDFITKKTVLLNFIAMMNYLQDHKSLRILFPKTDDSGNNNSIVQTSKRSANWHKVILQISGTKLGTVQNIEMMSLFFFLLSLAEELKPKPKQKHGKY